MGFLLTITSAVLLTVPNYKEELYFLSWIALLPFLYYLFIFSKNKLSYQNIFLRGWNLGFWILVFSANFLYHSIKLYTEASFLTIILILIFLFLFLSLIYGVFFSFYFYLQRKFFARNKFRPFLFTFCWTIFELSRHYFFYFFPLASPAYTQTEFLSFIQLAEVGGIWILTFILIFFNALFFQLVFQRKFKNIFIIILLFVIIFSFGHYRQQKKFVGAKKEEAVKIGIITSEIKQQKKWTADQLNKNIELTLNAAAKLNKTQLIIAPETNLTFDFYSSKYYRKQFLDEMAVNFETPIQIGSLASKESVEMRYNSSFLISDTGEILSRYNKNLLLYFGESYPLLELLNKYTPYSFSSLKAGEKSTLFKTKDIQWKTVTCSEILYPSYVKTGDDEVDFIVNQTNEAWFNDSKLLKNIMWQAAVLRAVENRIPVIKTGNLSHNGIVYPSGRYQKVNSEDNYHILKLN